VPDVPTVPETLRGRVPARAKAIVRSARAHAAVARHPEVLWQPERFCAFIGYPRSGHTLVGALLNSHPDIVISHELDAMRFVKRGVRRSTLFGLILARDAWFTGQGSEWTGFDYSVEGQWQGRARRYRVIGDKRGGHTSLALMEDPDLVEALHQTVRMPVAIIHVTRNPFDNIARMAKRSSEQLSPEERLLHASEIYFEMARVAHEQRDAWEPRWWIDVRHEDFCADPKHWMTELSNFLQIEADSEWLATTVSKVHESPSRSRDLVDWPSGLVDQIHARLDDFIGLRGYRFDD
jgi:hypothetical protein